MKTPKVYQIDFEDIDNESGRNAKGDMMRDVVASKVKLNVEWGPLTNAEASTILKAIKQPFFQATYYDALEGGMVTKTFYAGSKSVPAYSWNPKFLPWAGLTVNFIER